MQITNFTSRLKAMAMHGVFSMLLLGVALYLVFMVWYPAPLQKAMGVTSVIWFLLGIDLVLGPLLTFIIFDKRKPELKRDIFIIVLLQLIAYSYGLYTVAQGRPIYQVFVVDDIELVRPVDIKGSVNTEYASSLFLPPQWVSAVYSSNTKVAQQQKQDEIFGTSLATRPETYQSLAVSGEKIRQKVKPISELNKFNEISQVNISLKKFADRQIIGYLPVKGFEEDMSVVFDEQAKPIAILDLRPW